MSAAASTSLVDVAGEAARRLIMGVSTCPCGEAPRSVPSGGCRMVLGIHADEDVGGGGGGSADAS